MTAQDIRLMLELLRSIDDRLARIQTMLGGTFEEPTFRPKPHAKADK
jgi:hypothetical protein